MQLHLKAGDYRFHTPEGDGAEKRSCLIELEPLVGVTVEVRSSDPVELRAITALGQTVFLDWGQRISFAGKLEGFKALEIVAQAPFSYYVKAKEGWLEKPDPKSYVVEIDESANKPMADLVKAELRKYLGRLAAENALASDVDVEELMDDLDNGDLEFEAEPDPFGLGYAETQDMEPVEPGLPLSGADPAQQPKPAQEPAKPGSEPAANPGPSSTPT